MAYSLRSSLTSLWVLILIMSLSIGAILIGVVRQGVSVHIEEAAARARAGCLAIKDRYDRYFASGDRPAAPQSQEIAARELTFLLEVVLAEFDGMEGGIWNPTREFVAYAYPSYQGATPKRDVPEAERPRIVELAGKVSRQDGMDAQRYETKREALILHACPLTGSTHDVAWTMTRVSVETYASNANLRLGLTILFLFAVLSGGWLWRLRHRWSNQVGQLEQAIAAFPLEQLPHIRETGERELDRIVAAVNHLSTRLAAAREETGLLSQRLAHADRLAALGRMTAALAHEIRNPIAAMRLKAENALTQSPERQQMALTAVLQQVHRLDGLLQRLMALIQPVNLDPQPVSLHAWLQDRISHHQEQAERSGVMLFSDAPDTTAIFDGDSMARAIDNLLLNAIQHTPSGGTIEVMIRTDDHKILFSVEDSGPGVPESERERMFEPFMTTRVDGTGLGLAIVREIAEAHNGTVRYEPGRQGARFTVELPWQRS
jgi:signal transduction histidine kinase